MTAIVLLGGVVKAEAALAPGFIGYYDPAAGGHGTAGTMDIGSGRVVCIQENFRNPSAIAASAGTITDKPQSAYVLAKYIDSTNPDVTAALWGFLNAGESPDGGIQQSGAGQATAAQLAANFAWMESQHAGIAPALAAMKADAAANAGPYNSNAFALTLNPGTPSTGTVTGIGLQSAAGNWQAGYPGSVHLTGPAVFDANGAADLTFTTSAADQSATWHATGTGKVTATRTVINNLPGMGGIPIFTTSNLPQIVAAKALPGSDPNQDSVTIQAQAWAPKLTTKVSSQLAAAGSPVHDTVTATGGKPGAAWTGTVDVYTSLVAHPKDGIPAAATPTTTVTLSGTFDATGNSTVETANVVLATGGYAYFWEHLAATADWPKYDAPKGGEITETVLVIAPDLKTVISSQTSNVGDTITDSVTANVPPAVDVQGVTLPTTDVNGAPITYTVSGIIAKGQTCTGPFDTTNPVFTFGPVPYVEGGTYGSYTIPAAVGGSCLTYVETLTATAPSGTVSVSHAPGLVAESTRVVKAAVVSGGAEIIAGTPQLTTRPAPGVWGGIAALVLGTLLAGMLLVTRRKAGQQA